MQRAGRKKRPFYRVVVADQRTARDGRFIEGLGHYDPIPDPAHLVLNEERALYWLNQGAQPSDTARSLLRKVGVWSRFKAPKQTEPAEAAPTPDAPEAAEEA